MKPLLQSNIARSNQAQEDAILECLRGTAPWCVTASRPLLSVRELHDIGLNNEWLTELLCCSNGWSLFQWGDRVRRALKRLAEKGLVTKLEKCKNCRAVRYRAKGQTEYQLDKSHAYFDWLRSIVNDVVVVRDTDHGNLSREDRSFILFENICHPLDSLGFGCYTKDGYYMFFRRKGIHLIYRDYREITAVEIRLLRWSLDLFKCKPDPICVATHPNPAVRKVNQILLQDWAQVSGR